MALRSLPEDISSGERQKLAQLDDKIQLVCERILHYSSLLIDFLSGSQRTLEPSKNTTGALTPHS